MNSPLNSKNKSSILLLSEIYPPQSGGSGRWFSEVYPKISRFKTHCLVNQHTDQTEHDKNYPQQQVLRADLQMQNRAPMSIKSGKRYASIAQLVRKHAIKLKATQLHAARPLFEGLTTRVVNTTLRLKRVCYVHGEDISVAATSRELQLATRYALGGKATIVANSFFTRKMLVEDWNIAPERIHVIHPGVNTKFFTPTSRCPQTRSELGWKNRPVVLTVGRLQKRKGQDTFIRAIPIIKKAIPDFLYAIVGSGNMEPELRSLAKQLGVTEDVIFHGEATDDIMLKGYQQCDLFSLPNRADGADVEGFGMVSLEAQSCGKTALVGNSGGAPETIAEGVTGFAIDCTHPDLLARKVIDLLQAPNLLERLNEQARVRTVQDFDWTTIVKQSEKLFESIN